MKPDTDTADTDMAEKYADTADTITENVNVDTAIMDPTNVVTVVTMGLPYLLFFSSCLLLSEITIRKNVREYDTSLPDLRIGVYYFYVQFFGKRLVVGAYF